MILRNVERGWGASRPERARPKVERRTFNDTPHSVPELQSLQPSTIHNTYKISSVPNMSFGDGSEGSEHYLDASQLAIKCPLDNLKTNFELPMALHNSVVNKEDKSTLRAFPPEVYHIIMKDLDLRTITSMRRTSQRLRHIVSCSFEYRKLYDQAPQVIRACLSFEIPSRITLSRLYHSLTSRECYYCSQK